MQKIISQLYELPLYYYLVMMVIALIVWSVLAILYRGKKKWKWTNAVVLGIAIAVIVSVTLVFRRVETKGFSLIPFSSFELARIYADVYQEMMLNVVLFFPVGLTMPFVLNGKIKHPLIATIMSVALFSASIEVLQYVFMRGYAEVDDVIFNTVGVVLGSVSFIISTVLNKKLVNNKENHYGK